MSMPLTLEQIRRDAYAVQRAEDSFDVALAGFAELVAAGHFRDAELLADETFRHWRAYESRYPGFTERYALT